MSEIFLTVADNGNKRIALVALNVYLLLNDRYSVLTNDDIYEIAKLVASSKPEQRDSVMGQLEHVIRKTTKPYELSAAA